MKIKKFLPKKIISGGQTGADRAGLDVAFACNIKTGGYIPKGRLAEDGKVPDKYNLKETNTSKYAQRTILNIVNSDATMIFHDSDVEGGTLLTYEISLKKKKPVLLVNVKDNFDECVKKIRYFLNDVKPNVLNIAGPRKSKCPDIYDEAFEILLKVFKI
ncbi:MAG TPA: putative molybdenum carrier protein [Elusimicrobiales bacterium]|nr:putative molybdenum carrier protein [Elusimicrobiales bacterium]